VDYNEVSTAVGWIAVVLGTATAFAQYRRMSTRGVEGVSFATWTLFIYVGVFWVVYGASVHSWQLVLGCSLTLPLQLLIWYRLRPWEKIPANIYAFLFIVVCCLLPALAWGWAGAVVGVGIGGWITRGPQLIRLVRSRDAAGVSTSSWLTAGVVSGLWVVYYIGARLWPVMCVTAVGGSVSLVIAALASWRHRQTHDALSAVSFSPNLGVFED
jgi:uncharacterized protein with PQ loop repeat